MQAIAPTDGIVVGEATPSCDARTIALRATLPPVALRASRSRCGCSASSARSRASRPTARTRRRSSGGTRSSASIVRRVRAIASDGAAETVTIVADPGLGKSRLVRELGRHVDAPSRPRHAGGPAGASRTAREPASGPSARSSAATPGSSTPTTGRRGGEARRGPRRARPGSPTVDGGPARPARRHPDGVSEPPTREEAFAAWRTLPRARSPRPARPSSWSRTSTGRTHALVAFLESLADAESAGLPLLLVATARPEVAERHPAWPARGRAGPRPPPRGARARRRCARSSRAVLGGASAELEGAVLERAAGSPLYAEQIAAMLRDRAAVGGPRRAR